MALNIKNWTTVCNEADLIQDSGVCALLEDKQIAIFHLNKSSQRVYAIGNYDPIGKANVIYRGIVGCISGEPVVASPLYKQHFSLVTGKCLQDDENSLPVYPVRVHQGAVQLLVQAQSSN